MYWKKGSLGRWRACLGCVAPCIRDEFYESRSLELEHEVGGNFRPSLLLVRSRLQPSANMGNMKMTLNIVLKVIETAEMEANDV